MPSTANVAKKFWCVDDWAANFPRAKFVPLENAWSSNIWRGKEVVDSSLTLLAEQDRGVGDCVGAFDGDLVGDLIGPLVGDVVGDLVGKLVGDLEGDLVGDFVGGFDGDWVGDWLGL